MRKSQAAFWSTIFFFVAPGSFAGLIPWLLTRWQIETPAPYLGSIRVLGVLLGQPATDLASYQNVE